MLLANDALVDGAGLETHHCKEIATMRNVHRVGRDMGATRTLLGGEELNPTNPGMANRAGAGTKQPNPTASAECTHSRRGEVEKAWKRSCNTYSPSGSSWEAMNVSRYRSP